VFTFAVALMVLGDLDRSTFFLSELHASERDGALVEPSSPFSLALLCKIGNDDVPDAGNSKRCVGAIEDGSIGNDRVHADHGVTATSVGSCCPLNGICIGDSFSIFLADASTRHERWHWGFSKIGVWRCAMSNLDGGDAVDHGVHTNVEGRRFPDIFERNIEVEMDCGGGSVASDQFDRNFHPRSQIAFGRILAVLGKVGGGSGVAFCDLQSGVGIFGRFDSGGCDLSRKVKVIEQSKDAREGDPEASSGPFTRLLGLIRRLPFGAKLGFSVLFALPAWAIMFRSWDRFDGYDGRLRNRREGLTYCGLAFGLLAVSAIAWW